MTNKSTTSNLTKPIMTQVLLKANNPQTEREMSTLMLSHQSQPSPSKTKDQPFLEEAARAAPRSITYLKTNSSQGTINWVKLASRWDLVTFWVVQENKMLSWVLKIIVRRNRCSKSKLLFSRKGTLCRALNRWLQSIEGIWMRISSIWLRIRMKSGGTARPSS